MRYSRSSLSLARAIGAFERRLTTPGRFDAFLEGDTGALTDAEVRASPRS